jgi:hypothetical protein
MVEFRRSLIDKSVHHFSGITNDDRLEVVVRGSPDPTPDQQPQFIYTVDDAGPAAPAGALDEALADLLLSLAKKGPPPPRQETPAREDSEGETT